MDEIKGAKAISLDAKALQSIALQTRTLEGNGESIRKGVQEFALSRELGIDEARKENVSKEKKSKATTGFESMLLKEVFKSMWSSVEKANLFGENSNESQIYQDMMIQAVSDETAKGKGVGIKAYLQREMDRSELAKNPKKGE